MGKRALPVHTFAQAQPMKNLLKIINLAEAFHQKSIRSSHLIMMQKSKVVPYYKILHRVGGSFTSLRKPQRTTIRESNFNSVNAYSKNELTCSRMLCLIEHAENVIDHKI